MFHLSSNQSDRLAFDEFARADALDAYRHTPFDLIPQLQARLHCSYVEAVVALCQERYESYLEQYGDSGEGPWTDDPEEAVIRYHEAFEQMWEELVTENG